MRGIFNTGLPAVFASFNPILTEKKRRDSKMTTNARLNVLSNREKLLKEENSVVAFHMKSWKHAFLQQFFPNKRFHFVDPFISERAFHREVAPLIHSGEKPQVFVWSQNLPDFARAQIEAAGLEIYYIEDGFIRSREAHAGYSSPYSLTLDRQRPYFDSRGASDLEDLLANYDFEHDTALMERARQGISAIRERRLTKYNGTVRELDELAGGSAQTGRKRILVIGQVEDDASIRFGCDRPFSNNDLVRLAASENPDAVILYKPHPDVLSGVRKGLSNPDEVAHLCTILTGQIPLPDALDRVDHVYTITSLAGFEALMRGKPVTVGGSPFYAGWGLTDDRQPIPRRGRTLSLEAIFAATYLLYPYYFNAETGQSCSFERVLELVAAPEASGAATLSTMAVKWEPWGRYGVLGWRHLLTPIVALFVARIGSPKDAERYRLNPAMFFRDLNSPLQRRIGRLLYPWH